MRRKEKGKKGRKKGKKGKKEGKKKETKRGRKGSKKLVRLRHTREDNSTQHFRGEGDQTLVSIYSLEYCIKIVYT